MELILSIVFMVLIVMVCGAVAGTDEPSQYEKNQMADEDDSMLL